MVWLNGRAFARYPNGCGFESLPVRFQVTALGKLLTRMRLCHQQYNLVPADGWWRSLAGKVTAGLAESNGSLPLGGWLQVTCGLTACTPGSAPGPTLGNECGRTFTFTSSGKCNVVVWRPSISPVTHQGAACDADSIHFGPTIRRMN